MARVRTLFIMVFIMLAAMLSLASPVYALDEPDSVSLSDIEVFEDLLVTGDFTAYVPYEVAYGTAPTINIDQTYIFSIYSADGATELGSNTAAPAYNGGYGSGAVSFYFASGMTWEAAYIFRVRQNPAYFPTPQYWDFVIGESNYSAATDQSAALKAKVIDSATFLQTAFAETLLARSEAGTTVLSSAGEIYFLDVIPGLQNMCPDLFQVQLENPDYTKRTWSMTFADALKTKYEDTILYDAMTGYAGLWSMDVSPAMTYVSVILFAVMMAISVWKGKSNMQAAFADGYALLLLLMLLGIFPMLWAGFMAFVSTAVAGVILFLNRA